MYIIHYWLDNRNAVLVARDIREGKARLHMCEPLGGWDDASHFIITPCRKSLTPRVLCLERKLNASE